MQTGFLLPQFGHVARVAAAALALLHAAPAMATEEYILPTLFDVTGVAADDVLNIRARPDANAEIIGELAPDATRVEVVAHDASGRWGRVNAGERSGWASLRYLAYRSDVWRQGELPATLLCRGNEPFWSLAPGGGGVVFSTPEAPDRELRLRAVLGDGVLRSPRRGVIAGAEAQSLTAAIVPSLCFDGMSSRAYGLDATVILRGEEGPRMLTGCCTIAPR